MDDLTRYLHDGGEEEMSNRSANPHISTILQRQLSRRRVIVGGLGAAVAGMFAGAGVPSVATASGPGNPGPSLPPQAQGKPPFGLNPTLGFSAIPPLRSDTATVPPGYKVQVLIPWGEPLLGNYPAYDPSGNNTGADQEQQVGSHHDGMHYFPSAASPNSRGLLCVNHEYVDQRVLHANGPSAAPRPADEVRKEIAAHGISVVDIALSNGEWAAVQGSPYNRRVTAATEMEIRGPVRGSNLARTKFSPNGTRARGTINNCAHGYTPWGTYLTCEENWAGYFVNRVQLTRIDALLDALYGPGVESTQEGAYYQRYYADADQTVGVIDETFDQKPTSVVYRASGAVLDANTREFVGTLDDLLAAEGIDIEVPREQARYGVRTTTSRYRWETADSGEDQYVRFDASIKGDHPAGDYRNEPNTMGWVVEIDPHDPSSTPKKRTTMGRVAHEGAWLAPPQQGQPIVFYMGDDAQNEYIYKFVTKARYREGLSGDVLDEGTLYVARFNEDGSGDWLALDVTDGAFLSAAAAAGVSFADQADVLVNTRLAADVVGATKLDRPEWGSVHPQTREVYFTLTNNSGRPEDEIDAANPRGPNPYGHIIRWREQGNRSWATRFEWDLFVLAGTVTDSAILPEQGGPTLTEDNIFASPDGLWFDPNGVLWIQTDMSGSQQASGPFGENAMLAANPLTGEIKRFLAGPFEQEVTGVVSTPDGKYQFVNFQHPGDRSAPNQFTSNWPDNGAVYRHPGAPIVTANPAGPRPRSATIVISREDGGVVGL